MELKHLLILAILIIAATPATLANQCNYNDCPLWARGAGLSTPQTSTSTYWYNDYQQPRNYHYQQPRTTQYIYYDVQHPPKHYYVHYNQNYHQHRQTNYRHTTRYNNYRPSPTILYGNGFSRYY